jgi:hypothetical protein
LLVPREGSLILNVLDFWYGSAYQVVDCVLRRFTVSFNNSFGKAITLLGYYTNIKIEIRLAFYPFSEVPDGIERREWGSSIPEKADVA